MKMRIYAEMKRSLKNVEREVKSHTTYYLLLAAILLLSLFIRVYRLDELLGFYFDQGRDALVIWDLWHKGRFFLIGPVTGLTGIFLGPFYYYLLAPLYLIGGGNPLFPAYFLAFLGTLAVLMMYLLGVKMHSRTAGIIAAILGGFSFQIYNHSRWLSNPSPILFTSMILLWSMWEIANKGKSYWWVIAALTIGVSLHFESASATFYIPMFALFALWLVYKGYRISKVGWGEYLLKPKTAVMSVAAFLFYADAADSF